MKAYETHVGASRPNAMVHPLARICGTRETGARARCRLIQSKCSKPATCRRSDLSAFHAERGRCGPGSPFIKRLLPVGEGLEPPLCGLEDRYAARAVTNRAEGGNPGENGRGWHLTAKPVSARMPPKVCRVANRWSFTFAAAEAGRGRFGFQSEGVWLFARLERGHLPSSSEEVPVNVATTIGFS